MMKGKKGFTLTEVLVSVAIAGILVVAVATVFIRYQRLENRFEVKENILTEIENIYALYTGSPATFPEDLKNNYNPNIEFTDGKAILYYDGSFRTIRQDASGNYLELEYSSETGEKGYTLYSLKITANYQKEIIKFTENPSFERKIIVGGENEE
jgi:prepilin-type N-terminal cleavage/methylation domain-containing protein